MNQPNCIRTFFERAAATMLSAKPAPPTIAVAGDLTFSRATSCSEEPMRASLFSRATGAL
jgi:hypothetical protein